MPKIEGKVMNVDTADEHLIRRLGKAVVYQWDELSTDAQKLIQEQAVFMHDRDENVQLNEQLSIFIRKNKGQKGS